MSSHNRRTALGAASGLLALLALGACGFEPIYADRPGGASRSMKEIRVDPIPDRIGQMLRGELRRLFNPLAEPTAETYLLAVGLVEETMGTAIRKDETVTRVNMSITGNYVLRRADTGDEVAQGTVRATNSYNVLASDFATLAAEDDARARAVREIAAAIQTRLALRLRETKPGD